MFGFITIMILEKGAFTLFFKKKEILRLRKALFREIKLRKVLETFFCPQYSAQKSMFIKKICACSKMNVHRSEKGEKT